MKHYQIIEHNAKEFAKKRNECVFITKAKKKTDYVIIFDKSKLTKNYELYKVVFPNGIVV